VSTTEISLAIETAISGGSLAILENGEILATSVGQQSRSRAEDILIELDHLLSGNHVNKHDISKIFVSAGPGSFTGIRIGVATAKGLARALAIDLKPVSLLESLAAAAATDGKLAVVLFVGREAYCFQVFERTAETMTSIGAPQVVAAKDLMSLPRNLGIGSIVYLNEQSDDNLKLLFESSTAKPVPITSSPAEAIGIAAGSAAISLDVAPLFLSKP